jgi:hypothetical protein
MPHPAEESQKHNLSKIRPHSLISAPRRAPRSILGAQAFSHFATAVLWPVGHAPPFANQGLNRLLRGRLLRAQTVAFRLRPQSGAHLLQTVRKVQDLGLEWRKEGAGRNFGRFPVHWPSDAT